jgi:hypothetical protein
MEDVDQMANNMGSVADVCRRLRETYDEMPGTLPVIFDDEEEVSAE